jgi:hypothetical protein
MYKYFFYIFYIELQQIKKDVIQFSGQFPFHYKL